MLHTELARALKARDRTWGEGNDFAMRQMHDELSSLKKHPRRYALVMMLAFSHRSPIGGGSYRLTRSDAGGE